MSYFTAVRIYSIFELSLFAALVTVAVGGWSEEAKLVLGWSHGVGWILLCALVGLGAARGAFTWVVLAATVSPAGPLGSTIGIEWMARRRPTARPAAPDRSEPAAPDRSKPAAPDRSAPALRQ